MESLEDRRAAMELALETELPGHTYRSLIGAEDKSLITLKKEDEVFNELIIRVREKSK